MKVLQINSVAGIRSTGRICTDIADVLIKDGNECVIAYGREDVPEKYRDISYRIGSDTDVKLHVLASRVLDSSGFHSKSATGKLIKYIDEYEPDVIHLHNIHGYYINVELLFDYLKKKSIPVIWTLHDCWAYTGHCSCYSAAGCDKWRTGCEYCPQKGEYPKSVLFDGSERNFARKKKAFCGMPNMTIVTPSEWLAGEVKNSFLGEYRVEVINNGIDLDIFKPTESDFRKRYGLEDKKIVLGVATAWGERKGLGDYYKLARIIDDRFRIVLVGLTEDQIKSVPKDIIAIERTNSAVELAGIYSASDVFVNMTYEDNYPTVNLEAQACGTPVITYCTGGSVESVPEKNIVEQGNIDAVAELITRELEVGRQDFSKIDMVKKYVSLIQEMKK